MAFIAPFRGLRYNPEKIANLEQVVTPPYDVIDERAQMAFARKNPYSMVHLDLAKGLDRTGADAQRYARAKENFERWQQEEVLIRDERPGLYIYDIDYHLPRGGRRTRRGLIALTRLADFSAGIVKPHEKTFFEVTSDRLRLMTACQAQFSQIFSLYSDPGGQVLSWLAAAQPQQPLCRVTDGDGNGHTLWQVTNQSAIAKVHAFFKDKSLYIADGHHRYTTALRLRDLMREQHGSLADDSPYNHVAMYLCAMEDPGLSVLPTHRVVKFPEGMPLAELLARLDSYCEIRLVEGGGREVLLAEALNIMNEYAGGPSAFGLYQADDDSCCVLRLKEGVMAAAFGAALPPPLRELDVVALSDFILGRVLGLDGARCEEQERIRYFSDPDEAIDLVVKEGLAGPPHGAILFLLNPTPVSLVQKVADAGLVMPHKSTYFYPKILTGLLMSKLASEERIVV